MKLLLVSPGWPKGRLWEELGFEFPSLSLASIAAATPAGWEVLLCDENLEPLNLEAQPDLVGISATTPQAPRAYETAASFRARGIPVVPGGFHASNLPDEALNHVDAVVVGEGEALWPRLTSDLLRGQLQRNYKSNSLIRMAAVPPARRGVYSGRNYLLTNTIQTTRGGHRDCEFCSVTSFYGRRYREKPLDLVLPGQPVAPCGSYPDDREGAELPWLLRRVACFDPENSQSPDGEGSLDLPPRLQGVAQSLHRLRRRAGAREFSGAWGVKSLEKCNRWIDARLERVKAGRTLCQGG